MTGAIVFTTPCVSSSGDEFRAPLVPALPIFVAFINIYLMASLSLLTWLLFGVWMSVGKVPLSHPDPLSVSAFSLVRFVCLSLPLAGSVSRSVRLSPCSFGCCSGP